LASRELASMGWCEDQTEDEEGKKKEEADILKLMRFRKNNKRGGPCCVTWVSRSGAPRNQHVAIAFIWLPRMIYMSGMCWIRWCRYSWCSLGFRCYAEYHCCASHTALVEIRIPSCHLSEIYFCHWLDLGTFQGNTVTSVRIDVINQSHHGRNKNNTHHDQSEVIRNCRQLYFGSIRELCLYIPTSIRSIRDYNLG
jgi:hypothetical protein